MIPSIAIFLLVFSIFVVAYALARFIWYFGCLVVAYSQAIMNAARSFDHPCNAGIKRDKN
jgi:hypothetical protein